MTSSVLLKNMCGHRRWHLVIVGDAKEIIPQVSTYAEAVEIFDTEGNPISAGDQEAAAN